jgi:ABC-type transport system substrate-binding protein
VRVRKAVQMAIDRDAVLQATYPGGAKLANTMIPAALLGSFASIVTGTQHSPAGAAVLLDEAGWTCGGGAPGAETPCAAGEVRQKAGAGPLSLKLLNGYTPIEIRQPADLVVETALEAVGAEVTLTRVGTQGEYDAALAGGTHDLYMERIAQNDANPASAPSNFFDSTASALTAYPPRFGPGAAFEALMAQARTATDREVAKQRTAEALHEALDVQAMGVHLASVNWLLGMKQDVVGIVPMGTLRAIRWAPVSRLG